MFVASVTEHVLSLCTKRHSKSAAGKTTSRIQRPDHAASCQPLECDLVLTSLVAPKVVLDPREPMSEWLRLSASASSYVCVSRWSEVGGRISLLLRHSTMTRSCSIATLLAVLGLLPSCSRALTLSRRQLCIGIAGGVAPSVASANDELPLALRDFTKLAPLGAPQTSGDKTYNLPRTELAKRLQNDLLYGSTGQGGYILSGDFSLDLFRDDCEFLDPNNRVTSLSQCQKALQILFDPRRSYIRLLEPLTVQEDGTIRGRFRVRGFLQFPWNPYITAYESSIVYTMDDKGLVQQQRQAWTKSATEALQESFTPTLFTPPPRSTRERPSNEPSAVSQLFDMCNGRRPMEYSEEERREISQLMDQASLASKLDPSLLPGKWMLVFLEPGPEGAGVDRRVPFPELPFNDQYQIFAKDSVTNVGELWGPDLSVEVYGGLKQASEALFEADIQGGRLCWKRSCADGLPIQGTGLFSVPYLGERVRILQNINGGGARGVQIRMD